MSANDLRAVVIGAGWAGEGHTKALQHCGVEVVAICARKKTVVTQVAEKLGIPQASTNWRQTLQTEKPDIIALATPATLRGEVIEAAGERKCHIFCDKPLATTAADAYHFFKLVEQAGVKHAYTATHCYDTSVAWVAELLANKTVGALRGIDLIAYSSYLNELTPWNWNDVLAQGGGTLSNGLPHFLGMLERMVNGKLSAVVGQARVFRTEAPYIPDIHDHRHLFTQNLTRAEAKKLEWRASDAEDTFMALLKFETPLAPEPILVSMQHSVIAPAPSPANGMRFYGDQGTLVGQGLFSLELFRQTAAATEPLPIPQHLLDQLPQLSDDFENKWAALAQDFVADIRGEAFEPYLTFEEGWRYQLAAEAIRHGQGWVEIESP